jgi:hypothetical protein
VNLLAKDNVSKKCAVSIFSSEKKTASFSETFASTNMATYPKQTSSDYVVLPSRMVKNEYTFLAGKNI